MRKLMWFTIGFAAACAFGAYFYGSWIMSAALLAVAAAPLLILLTHWWRPVRIAAGIAVGLAAGFVMFLIYDGRQLSDAAALDGQTVRTTVIIRDYSYETDYGCAAEGTIEINGKDYRICVYLNDPTYLEPGNRVIGEFRFRYTSSGGMDEVLYQRGQGIFLLGYQQSNCVVERCWSTPGRDYPAVWRQKLREMIQDAFPEDVFGFAKALLLGDRTDVDYETSTAFKVSGISHIIAVSGLHVSILFSLVYFLSGRRKFLTAVIGFPVLLVFAAIVGFTPSITRAAVMQMLVMTAAMFDREYDPPTALSFAALVMLVANPLVITSVSFQLSFACMAGIFLLAEPIQSWLMDGSRLGRWDNRITKGIAATISVSLGAGVFTTPLVAVYFGTVSLISVVTNMLTLWVITFIFYGIVAVCLVSCFSVSGAAWLGAIVAWPMRYVLAVAGRLAEFPLAAVYTKSVYIVIWLVMAYVLLGIYALQKEKRGALFTGLVTLMLCAAVGFSWMEPWMSGCRLTMLDVGQGQAILLQGGGKTFLVDCGGDSDESAADMTAETLLSQGIRHLDGIILTHYDSDHSGGLRYLLTRIDTELLLIPNSLDENGVGQQLAELAGGAVVTVMEDTVICCGGVKLTLFAPESYNSGNESSMCVLFQAENCDILITGDRGEAGERLLMKYHELPQVDVLVVGHHGSKYSTSEALLEAVRPKYAFISVSEDNSYGHPAQVILDRLAEYGCIIYRTDECGTIIFRG